MKGVSVITLKDAETGETIKRLTEHNIVTDAVQRILNPPVNKTLYNFSRSGFFKSVLPVYKNLFSGIILLGNSLEENADSVMLTKDCIPIATAGGAYTGTSTMRGTLVEDETYATENGYHFTWDFDADKANGTIKCVALTSSHFGNTGFTYADSSGCSIMNPSATETQSSSLTIRCGRAPGVCLGSFEKNTLTYFYNPGSVISTKTLTFKKYQGINLKSIGIFDEVKGIADSTADMSLISTNTVAVSADLKTRMFFYNNEDGLMYFGGTTSTLSNKCTFHYVGIDMTDYTIKAKGDVPIQSDHASDYCFAVYGGKIFLTGTDVVARYSTDGTLEKTWSLPFGYSNFSMMNDVLVYSFYNSSPYRKAMYLNDEFYEIYNGANGKLAAIPSVDTKLPYSEFVEIPTYMYESSRCDPYLGLISCYLATINNLSEPVTKTSGQTLRITYDITN